MTIDNQAHQGGTAAHMADSKPKNDPGFFVSAIVLIAFFGTLTVIGGAIAYMAWRFFNG